MKHSFTTWGVGVMHIACVFFHWYYKEWSSCLELEPFTFHHFVKKMFIWGVKKTFICVLFSGFSQRWASYAGIDQSVNITFKSPQVSLSPLLSLKPLAPSLLLQRKAYPFISPVYSSGYL